MRALWAVYKRELALYFRSPIAYGVAFALIFFLSLLFSANLDFALTNGNTPADAINNIPSLLAFLTFLVAPLLTMRLLSEEQREGTMEVLLTLPMGEGSFVIGKFLAVWTYYTFIVLVCLMYPFLLSLVGAPDPGRVLGGYVGAWLYGGATLAVCMIWSALFEDQVVAAFLGAASVLVLYLADVAAGWVANQGVLRVLEQGVRELSLSAHYNSTMLQGIFRGEDVLYFVLLMGGSLFVTVLIVSMRRWRA